MTLIELSNVSKVYKTRNNTNDVLSNINLKISEGENISIIGPSGCGKSTLLNMIGLLTLPTSGTILLTGKNTNTMSENQKANYRNKFFGYISQDFALMEDETVFENIEIPLLYNKTIRNSKSTRIKKVKKELERVGLSEKLNEKVNTLSGGQRQRVAIARSLINSPKILLCDEPTGSLDKENGFEIFKLLMRVASETGKAMILVTHDLDLATKCSVQIKINDKTLQSI